MRRALGLGFWGGRVLQEGVQTSLPVHTDAVLWEKPLQMGRGERNGSLLPAWAG